MTVSIPIEEGKKGLLIRWIPLMLKSRGHRMRKEEIAREYLKGCS
jgi:hypothetical protein